VFIVAVPIIFLLTDYFLHGAYEGRLLELPLLFITYAHLGLAVLTILGLGCFLGFVSCKG